MWSDPILTSKWMNKKLYGKLVKYTQLFFLQATRFGNSALKTSLPRRCSYGFVMHSCQQMSAELKDKFLSHCSKKYQLAITCRLLEKRVTLICLLCQMLVIIHFRKYHKYRESFQRFRPGILPKHWAGYYCLTTRAKHNIVKPTNVLATTWSCHFKKRCLVDPVHSKL